MPVIRRARPGDVEALTRISFASKAVWGYPPEYFAVWARELTITPSYLADHEVFVFEKADSVVAYYSLVELTGDVSFHGIVLARGFWLEHMFVEPGSIGKGIGRALFAHLLEVCTSKGVKELGILADPNARGFYQRMGCRYLAEYPSTIRGRTTPYLAMRTG